jgi:hypothetical protein
LWVGSRTRDRTSGGQYSHCISTLCCSSSRLLRAAVRSPRGRCEQRTRAARCGCVRQSTVLSVIAFKTPLGTFCHFTKKSKYCAGIELVTLLHCYVSTTHCATPHAVSLTRTLRGPYKNMSWVQVQAGTVCAADVRKSLCPEGVGRSGGVASCISTLHGCELSGRAYTQR